MTEEQNIGTAKIDIKVDVSQLQAAVEASKRSVASMSADAQAQYNKLDSVEKRRVERLIKHVDTLGMTKAEQLRYNAALRTSGPLLDELNKKISQNEARLKASGIELNRYGISAKQQAAALRGVPAQLTDIFIGLQGGQNPLTVMLQQGGQLKDMFGGIVPAVGALGNAFLGLINPATIAASVVLGLGLAWKQGSDEVFDFSKALAIGGDQVGYTASELRQLVAEMDKLEGVSRGTASLALKSVADSGRFAGEQFMWVSASAARMSDSVGVEVDRTVAKFEKIADKPVEALLSLNEKEHFLTDTQYERVRALQEEGREQDAVAEAVRIYAQHLDEVARKVESDMPATSKMWRAIKEEIGTANGEISTFLGLMIKVANIRIDGILGSSNGLGTLVHNLLPSTRLRQINAWYRGQMKDAGIPDFSNVKAGGRSVVDSKAIADERKAEEEWGRLVVSNLSKREKLEREIADIRKAGAKAGKDEAEIQAQIAQARARFAESEKKSSGSKVNPAESLIRRLQQQNALNEEQIKTGDKLTASERLIVQVREELERITAKVSAANRARIASLLGEVRTSGEAVEQFQREAKAKESLARQNAILAQQAANRRDANELDLARYGLGDDAVNQMQRRLTIDREYTAELKRLGDRSVAEDKLSWDRMADNARLHRDQQLREEEEYQRQRAALMGDWRNGATSAIADFMFKANDSASQWYGVWSNSLNGLSDLVAKFATTGKASIKDLASSILSEISRVMTAKAVAAFVDMLVSLWGGTGTGGGGKSTQNSYVFPNAKGGVYGAASIGAYSNQIVSKPTIFPFAKGGIPNVGLMGEAGSEAIMPLKRLPDGRLGVHSTGTGGVSNVTTIVNIQSDGSVESTTKADNEQTGRVIAKMIETKVVEVVARESRQGGMLWKQRVGA